MRLLPTKKHKHKRFKPRKLVKRLTLLATFFALGWLVFLAGRGVYQVTASLLTADKLVKTAQAEQIADLSGVVAEAVVLRQETVILADKPGRANLLLVEGADVKSGQRVVELVDKTLLASIEEELGKLTKAGSQPDAAGAERLAQLEEKLGAGETKLQTTMDDYRRALRNREVVAYRELYSSLNSTAKGVAKLQQDRMLLLQSQNSIEERRAELESKREQAVVPVFSPAAGKISFRVDGLEQLANPANLRASLFDDLKKMQVADYQVGTNSSITAGQPIFKVDTSKDTYLLVSLPQGAAQTILGWSSISIQVASGNLSANWPATLQPSQNLGVEQCLFKVNPNDGTTAPRFLSVTLHTQGEVLCRVPKSAVISTAAGDQVFLLDGSVVKAQAVSMRQPGKGYLVVAGITPGANVVTNPSGLADGVDVSSRLRK